MVQLRRISLCLFACLGLVSLANAQLVGLECPPFTTDLLGSTSGLLRQGLLATSLTPGGEVEVTVPVRVIRSHLVCEASGLLRNTASYVSVLVDFQCDVDSTDENLVNCDGSTVLTRQYQFECNPDTNEYYVRDANFVQTVMPTVDFNTTLATSCIRCIDDISSPANQFIDASTHCDECPTRCLNVGLGRCYRDVDSGGLIRDNCCSYYKDNRCVENCAPLVANSTTFDCECEALSTLNNGNISYSNLFAIGSVATHTCNTGFRREGGSTRTCTISGWNGPNITCERVQCPTLTNIPNGMVSYSSSSSEGSVFLLGTEATYICDDGYSLRGGDEKRTCRLDDTWSGSEPTCVKCNLVEQDPNCIGCTFDANGNEICICKEGTELGPDGKCVDEDGTTGQSSSSCSPGCIAGIVLAILGAIIMAIVVALVVYAVYSYLSNPATKLAKAGTEGLNGVARDNPLYLPPEEIVEDVDKVGDVEVA